MIRVKNHHIMATVLVEKVLKINKIIIESLIKNSIYLYLGKISQP